MALEPVGGKYEGVWINKLKNGDISYYINYRDESGKPVKVSVGKKTKGSDFSAKDAYTKLIEIKYKLQHDQEPNINTGRTKKIKFDDIWQEFFKYAKANKKSWKMDELNYNKHLKLTFGEKPIKGISSLDFENFKNTLINSDMQPQTIKHQLTLARTIINHAIKHEIIKGYTNPFFNGKVKMPEIDNTRLAYLTKEEAKEILSILKSTHLLTYHLTILLLFTGARFSEITGASSQKNKTGEQTGLIWNNINFKNNTIFFRKTKQGNERHIVMNPLVQKTLHYLIENKKNERVITNSVGGIVLKMPQYFMSAVEIVRPGNKEQSSKYKITAHSLRHTHASWLAEEGLDIMQIKDQLGHKDLTMTLRYAHLIPNKRNDITRNLNLF